MRFKNRRGIPVRFILALCLLLSGLLLAGSGQIGRASCRERVSLAV